MPIEIARDGPAALIGGSRALRLQMQGALALMQYGRLFQGQGTIDQFQQVRIDNQGPWNAGPGDNIQAQVGRNSLAAIRIANELSGVAPAHQQAVLDAVETALEESYRDGDWYEVTGTSP
jgi:hypothetical protein